MREPSRRMRLAARPGPLALAGSLLLGLLLTGCPPREAPPPPPPPTPTVFVRSNIDTLTTAQLDALKVGIKAMQARPITDVTSWLYQANIHGFPSGDGPAKESWATCQHGSFFFLSWHRMYLYYFERILRAATGDPNFALPYWNYSNGANPNARQIPLPYREPADASNALWIPQRSAAMNAGGLLSTSAVNFGPAFTYKNFCVSTGSALSFGGQLLAAPNHSAQPHSAFERTPHDDVHVQIGGYMGSFSTAARDPVFWLHHANIDRLWKRWLDQQDGRGHADAAQWLNHKFVFFDVGGTRVELTGAQILDTVAQLDYRYDDDPADPPANPATPCTAPPPPTEPAERSVMAASPPAPIVLEGARRKVALQAGAALRAATEARNLVLTVDGITFDRMPDTIYEIYLNLPEGQEPDPLGPYYVGNLTFFGLDHAHEGHGPMPGKHAYRINAAVDHLKQAGQWQEGALAVTFLPRGPEPPPGIVLPRATEAPAKVTIGSIALTLE